MNLLTEIYRRFLSNGHFGPEARLVYMGGETEPPPPPIEEEGDVETTVTEGQKTEETPAEASADKSEVIKKHEEDVKNSIKDTLTEAYKEDHPHYEAAKKLAVKLQGHTETEFNKLHEEYTKARTKLGNEFEEGHEDITSIHEKAKNLATKITERLGEHKEAVKDIHEEDEATREKARDALTEKLWDNKGLKEAILKLTGSKIPVGRITINQFKEILKNPGNTKLQSAINTLLNDPKRAEALADGEFKTEDLNKALLVAWDINEDIGKLTGPELKILKSAKVTINGKPVGLEETFGSSFAVLLSMHHDVTQNEEGEAQIGKPPKLLRKMSMDDLKALGAKLTPKTSEKYGTYIDELAGGEGKTEATKEAAMNAFTGLANTEAQASRIISNFEDLDANPDKVDALKSLGGAEMIAALFKVAPLVKEAIETGDFTSASELVKDTIKNPRTIGPKIDQATKTYANNVKDASLAQLIAIHHEPRGGEAAALVGEDTPYRILMKEPVKRAISNKLKIGDITSIEGDIALTRITTTERGEKSVIEIKNGGTPTRYAVKTDKEGKETWSAKGKAMAVEGEDVEGEGEAVPEEQTELAGVDPNLVGKDKVVKELKGENNKIHNVLKYKEVESAVITIGEKGGERAGQDLPAGTKVIVKRNTTPKYKETFTIAEIKPPEGKKAGTDLVDKRFYVYEGDKIESVIPAKKEEEKPKTTPA